MPEVKWLPEALADIERLHAFLFERNTDAAARAMRVILDGANMIKAFAYIGKRTDDDTGRREFFTSFSSGAYVLRYYVEDNKCAVIIRVWHSREKRG